MINDDRELLEINTKFLRNEGYEVMTATDANTGNYLLIREFELLVLFGTAIILLVMHLTNSKSEFHSFFYR